MGVSSKWRFFWQLNSHELDGQNCATNEISGLFFSNLKSSVHDLANIVIEIHKLRPLPRILFRQLPENRNDISRSRLYLLSAPLPQRVLETEKSQELWTFKLASHLMQELLRNLKRFFPMFLDNDFPSCPGFQSNAQESAEQNPFLFPKHIELTRHSLESHVGLVSATLHDKTFLTL